MNGIKFIKKLKVLFLINIGIVFSVNAYQLPDGVPDIMDTWGTGNYEKSNVVDPINGIAPESWEDAKRLGLNAYYIDSSAPNSTNSKNTYGSPELPRNTIPEITYEAGSYVEIHGGPYTGGGQIIFTADGTPQKPVWFRGISEYELGKISGEVIVKGQYVILENLNFINQKLGFRSNNNSYTHHAVIRNSLFEGNGKVASSSSSAIAVQGSVAQRFHDIIIYNNKISNYGESFIDESPELGLSAENDYHGIKVATNTDRVWVLKNDVHDLGGDSIQLGNATVADGSRSKGTYIADNDFYENLENGIDVKAADDTLIINNRIWGFVRHKNNSSTGAGIIIHSKALNTWVVNNYIYNNATAVAVTDSSLKTWVIGNILKDNTHPLWDENWTGGLYDVGSAIHFRGGSSGGAINNTILNYDKGIEAASGQYDFVNNILFNRNSESGHDLYIESSSSNNLSRNNLIYSEQGVALKKVNVSCISCIDQTNPIFQNLSVDVSLSNDSIAVASGWSIDSYLDNYKSVFGVDLTKDIYGKKRVKGGIDIGASENQFSDEASTIATDSTLPSPAQIIEIKLID